MDKRLKNSPYLLACNNKKTGTIPIWLMRQAGRYMESYRQLRSRYDFLTLVKTPELAVEITLQPIKEFSPDAAIIFADILPILEAMGFQLQFVKGDGPLINNPIKNEADIIGLKKINSFLDLEYTLHAIKLAKKQLTNTPLIGFSGAPFTLAYYAIEPGSNRTGVHTMSLMYTRPDLWHMLMEKLTAAVMDYVSAQIESGADAIQLFDSWAGMLSPYEYECYVLPYVCRIVDHLAPTDIPVTYFSTQTAGYMDVLNTIPCHVLGVDWRIDIAQAWLKKNNTQALQGNLSPYVLLGDEASVRKNVCAMLQRLQSVNPSMRGYIFNLGHGIHKNTPVKNVHALFDEVRTYRVKI